MYFRIVGNVRHAQTFASGSSIREISRLRKAYGAGRWSKRKGIATVVFEDGTSRLAEVHWYELAEVGRKEYKIKRLLD